VLALLWLVAVFVLLWLCPPWVFRARLREAHLLVLLPFLSAGQRRHLLGVLRRRQEQVTAARRAERAVRAPRGAVSFEFRVSGRVGRVPLAPPVTLPAPHLTEELDPQSGHAVHVLVTGPGGRCACGPCLLAARSQEIRARIPGSAFVPCARCGTWYEKGTADLGWCPACDLAAAAARKVARQDKVLLASDTAGARLNLPGRAYRLNRR
jgi:hypothetical protein